MNALRGGPEESKCLIISKSFGNFELIYLLCNSKYFYMENNHSSAEDIKTIRRMMEESTKFLSLSGFSGVFLGLFAIAGAMVAWFIIPDGGNISSEEYLKSIPGNVALSIKLKMAVTALAVLIISVSTALFFSFRNARRSQKSIWTPASKRLLINLSIPLAAGGAFALILAFQNHFQLIIPVFLVFYGFSLINAGKFTYDEIFYLGIFEILTGLVAALFPQQGLLFWILGFGILHIVYGVMMYRKYEI